MRVACLAAVAVVVALACATAARADGDPASDILIAQDAFLPYGEGIPDAVALKLRATVRDARKSGDQLKVAVIASRSDLGLVQQLWLKPRTYGPFLGKELRFVYKGLLVIVMPNGFGVYRDGKDVSREQRIVDTVPPGQTASELTEAMTKAVERLSRAPASGGSSDTDRIVIAIGAAVVIAFLGLGSRFAFRRHNPGRNL
jgi:hypothetical protein